MNKFMKFILTSDTHGEHHKISSYLAKTKELYPEIDTIIHAGDGGTYKNPFQNEASMRDFLRWYSNTPFTNKLYIPGNHDTSFEKGLKSLVRRDEYPEVTTLLHESIELNGLNIFGSPYTPSFYGWAYNVKRSKLDRYWNEIPENTDILVTHGPPMGVLDYVSIEGGFLNVGCKALMNNVERVKPKLHVFGHIHDDILQPNYGSKVLTGLNTLFLNVSLLDQKYDVKNAPVIVELEGDEFKIIQNEELSLFFQQHLTIY